MAALVDHGSVARFREMRNTFEQFGGRITRILEGGALASATAVGAWVSAVGLSIVATGVSTASAHSHNPAIVDKAFRYLSEYLMIPTFFIAIVGGGYVAGRLTYESLKREHHD